MEKKSSYLADYLKDVIDKKYRTRSEAADDLGIDESVLSRICSGKRPGVSESIVEKICESLGLDKAEGVLKLCLTKHAKIRQFFSRDQKPIQFKVIHPDPKDKAIDPEKISETYSPVPVVPYENLTGFISFRRRVSEHTLAPNSWVQRDHNIQCGMVKGPSMAPTLPEGGLVAVDFDDRDLANGNIYLLKWKKEIVIRRIFKQGSSLMLCSDNPEREKYPIEICSLKKARSIKDSLILGRIIWSMSEQ